MSWVVGLFFISTASRVRFVLLCMFVEFFYFCCLFVYWFCLAFIVVALLSLFLFVVIMFCFLRIAYFLLLY